MSQAEAGVEESIQRSNEPQEETAANSEIGCPTGDLAEARLEAETKQVKGGDQELRASSRMGLTPRQLYERLETHSTASSPSVKREKRTPA